MEAEEQKLELVNREELELTGVQEVINYDEGEVNLEAKLGNLLIKGEELHIKQLDLEKAKLRVEGYITELKYDNQTKAGGFFKRLFK
jgi:sporulation protein YabP